jgi:hypothetical protein
MLKPLNLWRQALEAFSLGDYDTAIAQWTACITAEGMKAVYKNGRGRVHAKRGDWPNVWKDAYGAYTLGDTFGEKVESLRLYLEVAFGERTANRTKEVMQAFRKALGEAHAAREGGEGGDGGDGGDGGGAEVQELAQGLERLEELQEEIQRLGGSFSGGSCTSTAGSPGGGGGGGVSLSPLLMGGMSGRSVRSSTSSSVASSTIGSLSPQGQFGGGQLGGGGRMIGHRHSSTNVGGAAGATGGNATAVSPVDVDVVLGGGEGDGGGGGMGGRNVGGAVVVGGVGGVRGVGDILRAGVQRENSFGLTHMMDGMMDSMGSKGQGGQSKDT